MSIYSTIEEVLVRDFEVCRPLSKVSLDKIVMDVFEELEGYGEDLYSERMIHDIAIEMIAQYIFRGLQPNE